MAGLIDFGLLGAGVDYGQIARAYTDGRAQKADRQLREAQLARQTKMDERADAQFAARSGIGTKIGSGDYAGATADALATGDFDAVTAIKSMSKEHRDEIAAHAEVIGSIALAIKNLPQEQRAAAFNAAVPALRARGLTDEELSAAGKDLSDAALDGHINSTLTIKDALAKTQSDRTFGETVRMNDSTIQDRDVDNRRSDAQFGETVRSNRTAEAQRGQGLALQARGQNLTDSRLREQNGILAGGVDKATRKTEADTRKEFNARPEVKEFRDVATSYRTIRELAKQPTAQNDIALVYSYMKMLDPGSVVREGEFATAQNAAGVPDRIRNAYNKAQSGEILNPNQRRDMVRSAQQIVGTRGDRYNVVADEYRGYTKDYGGNPDRVTTNLPTSKPGRAARAGGGNLTVGKDGVREWRPRGG